MSMLIACQLCLALVGDRLQAEQRVHMRREIGAVVRIAHGARADDMRLRAERALRPRSGASTAVVRAIAAPSKRCERSTPVRAA
jgi:hypothetical protein